MILGVLPFIILAGAMLARITSSASARITESYAVAQSVSQQAIGNIRTGAGRFALLVCFMQKPTSTTQNQGKRRMAVESIVK